MNNTDSRAARYLRRAASGALLTAPALTVPVITAPAGAAAASPAAAAPACHQPGHRHAAASPHSQPGRGRGRTEELIANLHPAPGATVPAAATISFLIAGQQPFPAPVSADVTVTVNGAPVTATAGPAESGIPVTYASHHDTRPRPAACEIPFTFTLPAAITATAHIQVTAHDSDGTDTARWTLTIAATTVPTGAVGGIVVAAAAGLTLLATQARRRRPHHPARS
jgi:hypothetical protein